MLDSLTVLTAAHCFFMENRTEKAKHVLVTLGAHDLRDNNTHTEYYPVQMEHVVIHEGYDQSPGSSDKSDDLALIFLYDNRHVSDQTFVSDHWQLSPVLWQTNPWVRPVCLPANSSDSYVGSYAVATGWGKTREVGDLSPVLREVSLRVISYRECAESYDVRSVGPRVVCAEAEGERGSDTCGGDSGGPLVVSPDSDGRYTLIGVTSWGKGCGLKDKPGVYSSVAAHLSWIQTTLHNVTGD